MLQPRLPCSPLALLMASDFAPYSCGALDVKWSPGDKRMSGQGLAVCGIQVQFLRADPGTSLFLRLLFPEIFRFSSSWKSFTCHLSQNW